MNRNLWVLIACSLGLSLGTIIINNVQDSARADNLRWEQQIAIAQAVLNGSTDPISPVVGPEYPNPALTPGEADSAITEAVVESPNFTTRTFRDVPISEKQEVCQEYGVSWNQHSAYEIDHFLSIEIGGDNNIKNLWPEPYHLNVNGYDLGAHTKDKVEDVLGRLAHKGTITLVEAQTELKTDWVACYKSRIGPLPVFNPNNK